MQCFARSLILDSIKFLCLGGVKFVKQFIQQPEHHVCFPDRIQDCPVYPVICLPEKVKANCLIYIRNLFKVAYNRIHEQRILGVGIAILVQYPFAKISVFVVCSFVQRNASQLLEFTAGQSPIAGFPHFQLQQKSAPEHAFIFLAFYISYAPDGAARVGLRHNFKANKLGDFQKQGIFCFIA